MMLTVAISRLRQTVSLDLGTGQAEWFACTDGTAVGINFAVLLLFKPSETILASPEWFVLAVVDSGACVSLMGVSVFYRRCPATNRYLASYPATPSGAEPTALVPVGGTCVLHSQPQTGTAPRMHCNAEGEWMVPVGGCICDQGYEPNVNGSACLGTSRFTDQGPTPQLWIVSNGLTPCYIDSVKPWQVPDPGACCSPTLPAVSPPRALPPESPSETSCCHSDPQQF
ncbi:unnamed protein product [Arctogadus glacialis]